MPGAMVVHVEASAEAGELVVGCAGAASVAQGGVDAFGSHEAGLFSHAFQLGTRGCRLGRARGGKIELIDHRFHHHVAGDVPQIGIDALARVEVQKHTVEHRVQVGARSFGRIGGVGARPGDGVEPQMRAIGGERSAGDGQGRESGERRAHEAQAHEELVAHQAERVEGQRLYLAFVHGPSFRDSSYKHFDIFGHKVEFWVFLLPERLTHLLIFGIFG